jgi:hypothetical protein
MTFKKSVVSLFAVSLLAGGMMSCQKKTSAAESASASASVPASASTSTSTAPVAKPTISFKKSADKVEIGYDVTLTASVVDPNGGDTGVTFTVDHPEFCQLKTSGTNKTKVCGLTPGKVIVTATCVSDTTVSVTKELEIIKPLPVVLHAIYYVDQLTNYTFTGSEVAEDGTKTVQAITKVADTMITTTDGTGAAFYTNGKDGDDKAEYLGEALGSDGIAYQMLKNQKSGAYVAGEKLKGANGADFLTKDTFLGGGLNSYGPNGTGFFYDLAILNPDWFSNVKTEDNTYTIEGTDEDKYAAVVETSLFEIIAPKAANAIIKAILNNGTYTFVDFASKIDTTITVTGHDSYEIAVKTVDDSKNYIGEISAAGETAMADDVKAFFTDKKGTFPALVSELAALKTAVLADDYKRAIKPTSKYTTSYTEYYTPTYFFSCYPEDYRTEYKKKNGKEAPTSNGIVKKDDGLHAFTFTAAVTDTSGNVTAASVAIDATVITGTDANTKVATYKKYLSTAKTFDEENSYLSYFTDSTYDVWGDGNNVHFNEGNGDIYNDLADVISSTKAATYPDTVCTIAVTYDKTAIGKATFGFYYYNSMYGYLGGTYDFTDFGKAATDAPCKDALATALKA